MILGKKQKKNYSNCIITSGVMVFFLIYFDMFLEKIVHKIVNLNEKQYLDINIFKYKRN